MAKTGTTQSKGKNDSNDKNSYVRSEFAIGAAIVCFALGFFVSRVASTPNPLTQPTAQVPQQQNAPIPVQPVTDNTAWVSSLEDQAAKNPDSAAAWTQLGNAYYDTDQYFKAIDAYEKSLKLSPGNPNILTDLGIMYRRVDKPEEAIRYFDEATAADPTHELSRYNKGIVQLHDLRDTNGALATWESLAELNPQFRSPSGQRLSDMIKGLK